MVQLDTRVDIPAAAAPVDYTSYGQQVGKTLEEGIGTILKTYKDVEENWDKEKLKTGILNELRQESPELLKYMKPNPTFEDVAAGAYRLNIVRSLYSQAKEATPRDDKGAPLRPLSPKSVTEQLAFATDDKGFQTIITGLQQHIEDSRKMGAEIKNKGAAQRAAAMPGSQEEKDAALQQDPDFTGEMATQVYDLSKRVGVKTKDVLAQQVKHESSKLKYDIEQAKIASREKISAAKTAVDKIKAEADNKKHNIDAAKLEVSIRTLDEKFASEVADHDKELTQFGEKANKIKVAYEQKRTEADNAYATAEEQKDEGIKKSYIADGHNLASQAEAMLNQYKDATKNIEEFKKTRAEITDARTNLVVSAGKIGVNLITPTELANNPGIDKGKKPTFGREKAIPAATPINTGATSTGNRWKVVP